MGVPKTAITKITDVSRTTLTTRQKWGWTPSIKKKRRNTMTESFNAAKFVNDTGKELVWEFGKARRHGTTSELIGDAMEQPVRDRLEQILPRGIAAGSGCVIDTYGNTSRQMDVILYEREICPVFCVNDSPETTYYPCEGVIAVGEVKSFIDKQKLENAFEKIKSVKLLRRNWELPKLPTHPTEKDRKVYDFRHYGQTARDGMILMEFVPDENVKTEIFSFILAGEMKLKLDTFMQHYVSLVNDLDDRLCPNVAAFLTGEMLFPSKLTRQQNSNNLISSLCLSIKESNSVSLPSNRRQFLWRIGCLDIRRLPLR